MSHRSYGPGMDVCLVRLAVQGETVQQQSKYCGHEVQSAGLIDGLSTHGILFRESCVVWLIITCWLGCEGFQCPLYAS